MVAKLRVLSALCALVAAVIVVWQTAPTGPAAGASVELRSTAAPLSDVSTTIKWPVIETVNPRPFDPCGERPIRELGQLVGGNIAGFGVVGGHHRLALDAHGAVGGLQHHRHVLAERLQFRQPRRLDHPRRDELAVPGEQVPLVERGLAVRPRRVGDVAERAATGKQCRLPAVPQNPSSRRTPWRRIRRPLPVKACSVPPTRTAPVARNNCS